MGGAVVGFGGLRRVLSTARERPSHRHAAAGCCNMCACLNLMLIGYGILRACAGNSVRACLQQLSRKAVKANRLLTMGEQLPPQRLHLSPDQQWPAHLCRRARRTSWTRTRWRPRRGGPAAWTAGCPSARRPARRGRLSWTRCAHGRARASNKILKQPVLARCRLRVPVDALRVMPSSCPAWRLMYEEVPTCLSLAD